MRLQHWLMSAVLALSLSAVAEEPAVSVDAQPISEAVEGR